MGLPFMTTGPRKISEMFLTFQPDATFDFEMLRHVWNQERPPSGVSRQGQYMSADGELMSGIKYWTPLLISPDSSLNCRFLHAGIFRRKFLR